MLIAVGRLEVQANTNRLWFGILAWLALRQALGAAGCLHAAVRSESDRLYWSLSGWDTPEAMRAYRQSGRHLWAMRAFAPPRAITSFAHWQADSVPDWPEAMRRFELEQARHASKARWSKATAS